MTAWLRRNTFPILATIAAAALVIIAFEVIDAVTPSTDLASITAEAEVAAQEAPAIAGFIKVALFLAVSMGVTLFVRNLHRYERSPSHT